jgi:FtsP/CotA-like multicopper oxidase with cupredoxin domain
MRLLKFAFLLLHLSTPSFSQLASPFGDISQICPSSNQRVIVDGFPSSPFVLTPFTDKFANPPEEQPPKHTLCRPDGHCIRSFDFIISQTKKRVFDNVAPGCQSQDGTWFLTYNGQAPGPTIKVPVGHESLVRFKNIINHNTGFFKGSFSPCLPSALGTRIGRPISVHFHGSASLAPYDGWAEDNTCFGEVKDYVYPNNRPTTGWYHDHALHITADNAYFGLAGLYIKSAKLKDGGCGEPWNLENIPEQIMILSDKVIDEKCQLYHDSFDAHKDNLYGDINMINGIPFPEMNLTPQWHRFRIVNVAVSRPFLLKIKDHRLNDISQRICRIIATDGGFRENHIPFPVEGLLIGVAERYEIVCNFASYGGRTVYFWNDRDKDLMKDVPYFCYSHLLAKAVFSSPAVPAAPALSYTANPLIHPIFVVLEPSIREQAAQMASNDVYHREFVFGRNNGHWTINGETWDSATIAADDVGQNTWELWKFKTGGGWFHPVHMHLVDFFIIRREKETLGITAPMVLRTYEQLSPKDVFYLGPSEVVYVVARFGPHKGDYMFHCHNLVHEDNDMMRAMKVVDSSLGKNAQSAEPFIINRLYGLVYNNWKYSDPMLGETAARPSALVRTLTPSYVNQTLYKNLYRIFYPLPSDIVFMRGARNPWQVQWCPIT